MTNYVPFEPPPPPPISSSVLCIVDRYTIEKAHLFRPTRVRSPTFVHQSSSTLSILSTTSPTSSFLTTVNILDHQVHLRHYRSLHSTPSFITASLQHITPFFPLITNSKTVSSPLVWQSPKDLEVIALSPTHPRTPSLLSSAGRKRQITPLLEASSSKRTILIVSRGSITSPSQTIKFNRSDLLSHLKGTFQIDEAWIDTRSPLSLPLKYLDAAQEICLLNPLQLTEINQASPLRQADTQDIQDTPQMNMLPVRHILLPFNLRQNPEALRDRKNLDLLSKLFPSYGLGLCSWCLIYECIVLPPKPWPKTIAGVPCYFALGPSNGPLPPLVPASWKNPRIAQDIDGRNLTNWDPVFFAVRDYFEEVKILITEVIYRERSVIIILENRHTDVTKLPCRVARIGCHYLYDDEMGRPEAPQAQRLMVPSPGNPDESQYDTMRPGIRLALGYDPSEPGAYHGTSAGVLVRDSVGNVYMTAASHGFPNGYGTAVYHPSPAGGRIVGELVIEISHTDVALVKLLPREEFVNTTFESEFLPEPVHLREFISCNSDNPRDIGKIVMLDSPDTGHIDGSLQMPSRMRVPSDDPHKPVRQWIHTTWFYMGQDSAKDLPEGMCGSAIWDEDGAVLGFFRYSPREGVMADWCAGIAADELMDRGYTIVDPTVLS